MISYKNDFSFTREGLERLFLSVNWHSGNYPELLYKAMLNYPTVITAYDGDKLVGLASTMDDGCMNAYVHYVLVDPAYQGYGIGRELIKRTNEVYKDYINVVLISYNNTREFYESCGYSFTADSCAMKLK